MHLTLKSSFGLWLLAEFTAKLRAAAQAWSCRMAAGSVPAKLTGASE